MTRTCHTILALMLSALGCTAALAESAADIIAALNRIDGRIIRSEIPDGVYELHWQAQSATFACTIDGQSVSDMVTVNDSSPITFSGQHYGNAFPGISGSARKPSSDLLVISFVLRPENSNTWYQGTVNISLVDPQPTTDIVITAEQWQSAGKTCGCKGGTGKCTDDMCTAKLGCSTVPGTCRWQSIVAIDVT